MGCGASSHAKEAELKPLGSASLTTSAKRRNSYQSPEMQLPAQEGGGTNPFAPNVVGTYSNHGMKPGAYGKPNAKINQDRGLITYPLADDQSMALLAVYDGHGANGELVSEFVMLKVPDMLEEAGGDKLWDDTAGLLKRTFDSADKQLRESTIASEVACALQPCNPATLQPCSPAASPSRRPRRLLHTAPHILLQPPSPVVAGVSPVLSPNIARPAAAGAGANDWGSGSGRGSGNGRGRGSGSGGGDSSGGGGVALPSSTRTAAQVQQQRLQQMRNSHRP